MRRRQTDFVTDDSERSGDRVPTSPHDYELIDFGLGRKLERFGPLCLDRPCPAAEGLPVRNRAAWTKSDGRFDRTRGDRGRWSWRREPPADWSLESHGFRLTLAPTPFGHVGCFPEQRPNWHWLKNHTRSLGRPATFLNLFAYTGGSTLALATPDCETVHVDASRSTVAWARRNAAASQAEHLRIRWIVDDARDFCRREVRRARRYDGVVLDPPSYGHGADGKPWSIDQDLGPLLENIGILLCGSPSAALAASSELLESGRFLMLSCHAPNLDEFSLRNQVEAAIKPLKCQPWHVQTRRNELVTAEGRKLDGGLTMLWYSDAKQEQR